MFYIPHPDFKDNLVERLAKITGFPEDQARRFLDALVNVTNEEEQKRIALNAFSKIQDIDVGVKYGMPLASSPEHVITIPLVEQENGTMAVDKSGYSAWFPLIKPKPKTQPVQPDPAQPSEPPEQPPSHPFRPAPGAYPGPSVYVKVDDWLGTDMELSAVALGKLTDALANAKSTLGSEILLHHHSGIYEKLEEK